MRAIAYVFRFVQNARIKQKKWTHLSTLSAEEIRYAHNFLISYTQLRAYLEKFDDLRPGRDLNKSSTLLKLSPYIDVHDILHVGGRLENAPIPLDTLHPIILPSKSRAPTLILRQIHMQLAHASAERTLHEARKSYWMVKGRPAAKRTVLECFLCRRLSVKPRMPQMVALPACRLQVGQPAFNRTGVDYFGSIEVTIFRRKVKR